MLWPLFRRLLLGTVIEAMLEEQVQIDFRTLHIVFSDTSIFNVPRLDNYMRFQGNLTATLLSTLDAARISRLEARLHLAWPELVAALDLPIGDRLTNDRNEVRVRVDGDRLRVDFDLIAD